MMKISWPWKRRNGQQVSGFPMTSVNGFTRRLQVSIEDREQRARHFADFVFLPDGKVMRFPDGADIEIAIALAEPAPVKYRTRGKPGHGEKAVLFRLGEGGALTGPCFWKRTTIMDSRADRFSRFVLGKIHTIIGLSTASTVFFATLIQGFGMDMARIPALLSIFALFLAVLIWVREILQNEEAAKPVMMMPGWWVLAYSQNLREQLARGIARDAGDERSHAGQAWET